MTRQKYVVPALSVGAYVALVNPAATTVGGLVVPIATS